MIPDGEVWWVEIDEAEIDAYESTVDVICPPLIGDLHREDYLSFLCQGDDDQWTIVPEEEWPDEVLAALAKRALLGEDQ